MAFYAPRHRTVGCAAKRPVANPKNPCGFLLCEASTLPTPYASSNRICRTSCSSSVHRMSTSQGSEDRNRTVHVLQAPTEYELSTQGVEKSFPPKISGTIKTRFYFK